MDTNVFLLLQTSLLKMNTNEEYSYKLGRLKKVFEIKTISNAL